MADHEDTLVVTNDPIAEVIKPDQVHSLVRFSQITGHSFSATLNRAVDLFMNTEAPAHIAQAGRHNV